MIPKVILYTAISLDGRTTGFPVDLGLFYSLAQRWHEDASLVGCDTLLSAPVDMAENAAPDTAPVVPADDPRPILVVTDSRGRLKSWPFLQKQPYWKGYVSLCTRRTPPEHLAYLTRLGVKTLTAGEDRIDYRLALELLNRQFGIKVARVDSGGTLNGALLRDGLVDELHLLVHPLLLGGANPGTFFKDNHPERAQGLALKLLQSEVLSEGIVLLSYAVLKGASPT